MAKEVMAFTESDIKGMTLTTSEFDTLKFLSEHAGKEMDLKEQQEFVAQRNVRANDIAAIWELRAKAEKLVDFIKTVCKHAFNIGTDEDLPKNVSWSKQSYTQAFADGAGAVVCDTLIKKHLVNKEDILGAVTFPALVKASGITADKLKEMFPDTVIETPKERTLKIK
jgi:hypothetical protein